MSYASSILCFIGRLFDPFPTGPPKLSSNSREITRSLSFTEAGAASKRGVVKWARPAYNEDVLGPRRAFLAVMTFQLSLHLRFSCPRPQPVDCSIFMR